MDDQNSVDLLCWKHGDPPTVMIRFRGPGREHLVTFRLEALQINDLDRNGHVKKTTVEVADGKMVPKVRSGSGS